MLIAKRVNLALTMITAGELWCVIFWIIACHWQLRINLSSSMPIGIWQINDTLKRGSVVAACVPLDKPVLQWMRAHHQLTAGNCPSGYAPFLKTVIGIPGDKVILGWNFIQVNEKQYYPVITLPYSNDSLATKIVLRGTYYLKRGEYWLFSDYHERSFDSRYFGTVHRRDIQYDLKPLWVL